MNCRRLWNSHQGTSSWRPWHLTTFWNLESRKWHFLGFSRGILYRRGCHVVSSEYAQDWEQCRRKDCRNVPGTLFERFTDLNQFKYAFNVNQNWEKMLFNFLSLYRLREVSHGHATGFRRTVSFKSENKYLENCYLIVMFGCALFKPISVVQLVCWFLLN